MSAQLTDLCRLCLEQNPDFSVHEDKISTKIAELLSGEFFKLYHLFHEITAKSMIFVRVHVNIY